MKRSFVWGYLRGEGAITSSIKRIGGEWQAEEAERLRG
jgi:hypothetical protein